jgi:hypothetical protein
MTAEIIRCPTCRTWYDLNYKGDDVVSSTPCKCVRSSKLIDGLKPLDYFSKLLTEHIKQGGNYEDFISKNQRRSKTS